MSNTERAGAGTWLRSLTEAELAYWRAKPQAEKDWWNANTKPENRPEILRTEISGKGAHERFLRLPLFTRKAIGKQLETRADAARIRLRQRGYEIAEKAPRIETPCEFSISESTTLEDYQNILSAFSDLIADHRPLIGDCSILPRPKKTILYAICWLRDHFQTLEAEIEDITLRDKCSGLTSTLNFLLTHLTTDWHDIAAEDKEAVERLRGFESFPDWALPLKAKYINEEKAAEEACEMTFQVMKDKEDQEKRREAP